MCNCNLTPQEFFENLDADACCKECLLSIPDGMYHVSRGRKTAFFQVGDRLELMEEIRNQ